MRIEKRAEQRALHAARWELHHTLTPQLALLSLPGRQSHDNRARLTLIGHRVDAVAGSRYSATIMGRHASARALFTAILVIAGVGMLHTISPAAISGQAGNPDDQREAVDDIRLTVKLEQSVDVVLPGEKVEYTATIENRTGKPQSNLVMRVSVVSDGHAMTWVPGSTFLRHQRGGSEVSLRTPEASPGGQSASPVWFVFTNLAQSVAPDQTLQVRWSLQVDDCALRNRWVRVESAALTDQTETASDKVQIYVAPHTDLLAASYFTAAHSVDNPRPAPGEPVRHTISIVNEGFVKLDDLTVHFVPDWGSGETATKFLRTVSEDASVYIAEEQGGNSGPTLPLDPKWINPEAGFRLDHLDPGEVLVLSWTDYIAPDAPIGATPRASFQVESGNVSGVWVVSTEFTVSSPRDLSINVETDDPGYLSTGYFPGGLIRMRVTVVNRAGMAHDNVSVTLDLPSAVSYIPGSGSYATPTHKGVNSRRLPDDWIYNGALLPTIGPGDAITITFEARVDGDIPPGSKLDVYGILRSPTEADQTDQRRVDIAETPDIEITLAEQEPVEAGGKTWFEASVRNSGSVSITDAKFGFEETCTATYVPGSLWVESANWVLRDDVSVLEQLRANEDISIALGNLDPDDTVRIRMQVQVADDIRSNSVTGPRLVVSGLRDEPHALPVAYARQAGIVVTQPEIVTAAELEATRDKILGEVREVARDTQATANRTEGLAEDIRETGEKTAGLTNQTRELAGKIKANTTAIEGQAGAILVEVRNANPWGLGWKWVLLWGAFGVFASLVAGFVVWVVVPPPPTLWRVPAWLSERHRRRRNPSLAVPATPPAWRSPSQWWPAAGRASEPLAAALRRVRDRVNGLRRH